MGEETTMVTGEAPQLKTMVPPPSAAACSLAAVQLPGVPSPTTAVGLETSRSGAGEAQVTGGTACSTGLLEAEHAAASAVSMARGKRTQGSDANGKRL
jgi:hypothetical protein